MDGARRVERFAPVAARVAGGLVALATLALAADYAVATLRSGEDLARVEALVETVHTDATAAPELEAERERQTEASLAREARARILAWTILVCGGVFVLAARSSRRARRAPAPSIDALREARLEPLAATRVVRTRVVVEPPPAEGPETEAFVDALVERFGRKPDAAIPILQSIQQRWRYLPDEALRVVCERTEITPAQIAGTSSFYAQFRRSPVGRHVVRVCHGTACHVAGAERIQDELRRHLGIVAGEDTDADRAFTIDAVACVGCCSLAPVMTIEASTEGRLTPERARRAVDAWRDDA